MADHDIGPAGVLRSALDGIRADRIHQRHIGAKAAGPALAVAVGAGVLAARNVGGVEMERMFAGLQGAVERHLELDNSGGSSAPIAAPTFFGLLPDLDLWRRSICGRGATAARSGGEPSQRQIPQRPRPRRLKRPSRSIESLSWLRLSIPATIPAVCRISGFKQRLGRTSWGARRSSPMALVRQDSGGSSLPATWHRSRSTEGSPAGAKGPGRAKMPNFRAGNGWGTRIRT